MKAPAKIEQAIQLCVALFQGMMRIGPKDGLTSVPTCTHSLRVGLSLIAYGYPLEVCLGGFGHDWKEDTEATLAMIERLFNAVVRLLVDICSLDPALPEKEAEDELYQRVVGHAAEGEIRPLIIKCADSLDNLRTNKHLRLEWQIGMYQRGERWLDAAKKYLPNADLTFDLEYILGREKFRMGNSLPS